MHLKFCENSFSFFLSFVLFYFMLDCYSPGEKNKHEMYSTHPTQPKQSDSEGKEGNPSPSFFN